MTKDEVVALMRDAGLEEPRVIPHTTAERKHFFDLYAGQRESRRSERVVRGTGNTKAVSEAIEKLKHA